MRDCVFCDIISGSAPARVVYEDDTVIAFLDIRPVAVGHTLVIPRRHAANLEEIDDEDVAAVVRVARRIARGLRHDTYGADGVNLMVNDGRAAMQTVYHHHMHVVPRSHGDKLRFAKSLLVRKDPDPDATAERVRAAIAAATA